jgi:hypothetical protein
MTRHDGLDLGRKIEKDKTRPFLSLFFGVFFCLDVNFRDLIGPG